METRATEAQATQEWVRGFVEGLHAPEEGGDAEPLLSQFSADGAVWNLIRTEPQQGEEAIRRFWEGYRSGFSQIRSTFERVIEGEEQAALEWHAEGTLVQGGRPLSYRGVTVLKRGGGGITEFASYYDPRPFLEAIGVSSSAGGAREERRAA